MRTTVDISGHLYRRLKSVAARRGCSVRSLVLRSVKASLAGQPKRGKKGRVKLPLVASKRPGWLRLDNRVINELVFP